MGLTQPYGINEVTELTLDGKVIGIGSPVVLCRPLPDATEEELSHIRDVRTDRRYEICFCIDLILNSIDAFSQIPRNRSVQRTLLKVLRQFRTELGVPVPLVYDLDIETMPLLPSADFGSSGSTAGPDLLDVPVSTGLLRRVYVPRCSTPGCGDFLTQGAKAPAIEVAADFATLTCSKNHSTDIPLNRFFLWWHRSTEPDHERNEVIHWTDRQGRFGTPPVEDEFLFPPESIVHEAEREIEFRWSQYDAENDSRLCLRLRFGDCTVRTRSFFDDAQYQRLLVRSPRAQTFAGYPIRAEFVDSIIDPNHPSHNDQGLNYRMRVKGIPFLVRFSVGAMRWLKEGEPGEPAVAIYPKRMHAGWRRYRVMAGGREARLYRVFVPGSNRAKTALECSHWPKAVSVELSLDDNETAGATWFVDQSPPRDAGKERISVGVDFGTTSSVVYFQEQSSNKTLTTETNAIHRSDFLTSTHWLSKGDCNVGDHLWFLPPDNEPGDPCLLPSALWELPDGPRRFIRWGDAPPLPGSARLHGFKRRGPHDIRLDYLRELLFVALPVMFERLEVGSASEIDLGFAYPLAMTSTERKEMRALLESVRVDLEEASDLPINVYSVNESLASVRAGGAFDVDELILVADLGGHTLDLALFSFQHDPERQAMPENLHQIGSIEFGGEVFVEACAKARAGSGEGERFDECYWEVRDAVAHGLAAEVGSGQIKRLLDKFHPMALEFVRTMIAAQLAPSHFPDERKGNGVYVTADGHVFEKAIDAPKVSLFLVGNGWRLEDFRAEGMDPVQHCKRHFEHHTGAFGLPALYLEESAIDGIQHSKHWVACGALGNAKRTDAHELDGKDPYPSRLPLGRTVELAGREYQWFGLAGENGDEFPARHIAEEHPINVLFERGPRPTDDWMKVLERAVAGNPYPPAKVLRDQLLECLRTHRLFKGPLTLILETYWRKLL